MENIFSFYELAVKTQEKAKDIKDISEKRFFERVKEHAIKADSGDKKAVEWLKNYFSPPVKSNSIWEKNSIYWPERVNLRGGVPAIVYSVNRKSRAGQ